MATRRRPTIPLAAILVAGLAGAAQAKDAASLEPFLAMSPQELVTVQVKLTPLAPNDKSVSTLVITVQGREVDWKTLEPWMRDTDALFVKAQGAKPSCTVSAEELRAMLEQADGLLKQEHERSGYPWLTLTVAGGPPGKPLGLNRILDRELATAVVSAMRKAFHADPKDPTILEGQLNPEAMWTFQWWGCALGLLPQEQPVLDVTDQVTLTVGGLRWNPQTSRYQCTVSLTNASEDPLPAPLTLALQFADASVRLAQPHGTTCAALPAGRDFVNLPMPTAMLEPGRSLETVVEFDRGEQTDVQFTPAVLAGPGER